MQDIDENPFEESTGWLEEDEMVREALLYDEEEEDEEEEREEPSSSRKKTKRQSLGRCHACKRDYFSIDGLKNHLKCHIFEDLYRDGLPFEQSFIEHCRSEAKKILGGIAVLKGNVGALKECTNLASALLSSDSDMNPFVDSIAKEIWHCLPPPSATPLSKFHSAYVQATNVFQTDKVKRDIFKRCLSNILPAPCSNEALEWFVGYLPLQLVREAEAGILRSMQEPHEAVLSTVDRDDVNNLKFQQSVYYVGGSTIKSVLRQACKSTNDKTWNNIVTCITERFLTGILHSAPISEVTEWTEAVDRGGLKHISDKVFVFVMALTTVLVKVEEETGSVLHKKVVSTVKDEPILLLWDEIIGGSLSPEDSDFLLVKVCYFFVNTWGAGIAMRRKNESLGVTDKALFVLLCSPGSRDLAWRWEY